MQTDQNLTKTQKRPCSGTGAFEYDIDIISDKLQRVIISREGSKIKEVLLTILMLNGIITVTEPDTPLNDADHVGSFFII